MSIDKHSEHYEKLDLEPIEVMRYWLTKEQYRGFLLGNIIKYISRYNLSSEGKGGITDLRKALDYLNWLIESKGSENA